MPKLENIILVDDDNISNFLSKRLLEKVAPGAEITILKNGREAYEAIKTAHDNGDSLPQLLMVDHNMPVMNGIELMQEISKLDQKLKDDIVLVLLSTHITEQQKEMLSKEGVKEFLQKPLSEKEIHYLLMNYF